MESDVCQFVSKVSTVLPELSAKSRTLVRYLGARIAGAIYFDRVSHTLYIIVPSPITPPFRRASVSLTTATINAVSVIHLAASHLLRARTVPFILVVVCRNCFFCMCIPTRCPVVIILRAIFLAYQN